MKHMNIMYIYLDDIRHIDGIYILHDYSWCEVRSVNEAKKIIKQCEAEGYKKFILDLDHDLGIYAGDGGDGYELVKWLVETGRNTDNYRVYCHSMNPVGATNILKMKDRYWPEQDDDRFYEEDED